MSYFDEMYLVEYFDKNEKLQSQLVFADNKRQAEKDFRKDYPTEKILCVRKL